MTWSGAAALVVLSFATPASASADDQAQLDAAMVAFNERMTDAGWVSEGPSNGTVGSDEDDDEPSEGDEIMAECFGDLPDMFQGLEDDAEFPGETARSSSDEFSFALPTDVSATTGDMFAIPDEEQAAAISITVDDAHAEGVGEFLDVFGAKETSECMKAALAADIASDTEGTDALEIPVEFEVEASTEGDLGIGEHSALMTFGFSMNFFGAPFTAAGSMAFASAGNHLVGVYHFVTGEADPTSGLDSLAELQTLLDAVTA